MVEPTSSTAAAPTEPHPKRVMFGTLAAMAQVLSAPARVEMIDLLAQGPRTVEQVAQATGLSVSNASQHLQQLLRQGLLANRREGRQVTYMLADPGVLHFYLALGRFTEAHSAEARLAFDRLYAQRDPIPPVTVAELAQRVGERSAIALDVRPAIEYRAGHIPGAINIPVAELRDRLGELPGDTDLIAYCRGRYCVYAYQAVELVRPSARQVRRLGGGFAAWREHGLPVE